MTGRRKDWWNPKEHGVVLSWHVDGRYGASEPTPVNKLIDIDEIDGTPLTLAHGVHMSHDYCQTWALAMGIAPTKLQSCMFSIHSDAIRSVDIQYLIDTLIVSKWDICIFFV